MSGPMAPWGWGVRLWRGLRQIGVWVLALLLLFEEWGWEPLAAWLGRLAQWPGVRWLSTIISKLPPWAALLTFLVPVVLLFPVKLLALFWIGTGHRLWGLLTLLLAKVAGTAVVAFLFKLTEPALMRMPWFAVAFGRWKAWKDKVIGWARQTTAAQAVRRWRRRLRATLGRWLRAAG